MCRWRTEERDVGNFLVYIDTYSLHQVCTCVVMCTHHPANADKESTGLDIPTSRDVATEGVKAAYRRRMNAFLLD